jgi:hypothetical protein
MYFAVHFDYPVVTFWLLSWLFKFISLFCRSTPWEMSEVWLLWFLCLATVHAALMFCVHHVHRAWVVRIVLVRAAFTLHMCTQFIFAVCTVSPKSWFHVRDFTCFGRCLQYGFHCGAGKIRWWLGACVCFGALVCLVVCGFSLHHQPMFSGKCL